MAMGAPDLDAIYREIDEPINVRKLFLGGLRSQSSERHLYEAFLPFGHIVDVLMVRGPNHKPKGFGFVTFSKAYMMEAVITAHPDMRVVVDGKSVEIKRISEGEPSRSKAALLKAAIPNENTNRIFVGGIPEHTTEQAMIDVFAKYGEVVEVEIPPNEKNGKPRGFAFVTFATKEIVGEVVATKYHTFLGRKVEVKRAIEKEQLRRDSAPPIPRSDHKPEGKGKGDQGGGRRGGGGGGGRGGGGGGGRGGGRHEGDRGGGRGGGMGGGKWGPDGGGRDFGRDHMRGMYDGPGRGGPGRDFDPGYGMDRPPYGMGPDRHMGMGSDRLMGHRGPMGHMGQRESMGREGPMGMERGRMMERGPGMGPRRPPGPDMPGIPGGPGGPREGRGPESGRGVQGFGAMDKWDEAMFDSMPSDEMLRRQFGDSPMDFPGFPGEGPSSRPGGSGGIPGDFRKELSEVERDLESSKNKMKEYYRTMYMWKLKWYQMMKTWTAAKAAVAAEATVSGMGGSASRDSFPSTSKPQGSSYGTMKSQWGQSLDQVPGQAPTQVTAQVPAQAPAQALGQMPGQAAGGGAGGDRYRGLSEDFGGRGAGGSYGNQGQGGNYGKHSQAGNYGNQGQGNNYSTLGSNYGSMPSSFGPVKKEPSYPGPGPGGPYGGGMSGI